MTRMINEFANDAFMFIFQLLGGSIFLAIGVWVVFMLAKLTGHILLGIWGSIHKSSRDRFMKKKDKKEEEL